jgi:hypothetical protein
VKSWCPQEQANYKQLTEDLEAELARVKKDASEHAAQLSAAAQAKGEAASAARSDAARSRVGSCPGSRCNYDLLSDLLCGPLRHRRISHLSWTGRCLISCQLPQSCVLIMSFAGSLAVVADCMSNR